MAGSSAATMAANQKATREAIDALSSVLGQIGVGGKKGLADVGVEFRNEVVRLLSTPGTGRVYRRGRVFHRASAPGQPPAPDTGRYRSSWTFQVGEDSDGPYVDVGTNDKRGPWFEFGTRRMQARPHARVAANRMAARITPTVARAVSTAQAAGLNRLPKIIGDVRRGL